MTLKREPERAEPNQVEIDHSELDSTLVSPATARFLSWAFVALLVAVPVSQAAMSIARARRPQALELFQPFVRGAQAASGGEWKLALENWRNGIAPATLHAYESAVESDSALRSYTQSRMQRLLTRAFGVGNGKVLLGSAGWLFYQPGLDYVTGPSIVASSALESAARRMVNKGEVMNPAPDPRPALLQLHRDCQRAGIHLVVFPVPDKVMMQPAEVWRGFAGRRQIPVPNNSGYRQLVAQMREQGLDWYDPTPSDIGAGEVRYLEQDTHWLPTFMDSAARELAVRVQRAVDLPASRHPRWEMVEARTARLGDLVDMLKLGADAGTYRAQTVTVQRVLEVGNGEAVQPAAGADVLLLGDSFTNVYSQEAMGWGSGAGLGEHLAYHLDRPVDVIAMNGGGASAVRAELARPEMAERLGPKRVIVYEFAIRNLAVENWPVVAMVTPLRHSPPRQAAGTSDATTGPATEGAQSPREPRQAAAPAAEARAAAGADSQTTAAPIVLLAGVLEVSRVPAPGTAPYRDCLTFIKVKVERIESGSYARDEMIVAFPAMKDDQWLPAARYAPGDRLRLTVIPFSQAPREIRSMQRADDTEDLTLRPHFAIQESRQ